MGNYYQPEIETMPVEQLQLLQSERLVEQVKHVYKNVEFYRNKMDEAGVKPEDIHGIEDLHKLPFITKDDLRDQYPYGLLGVPLSDCVRPSRCRTACESSPPAEPPDAGLWHFILRRIWISGRSAAPEPLWRQGALRTTCAMSATDTACLPEARA